MGSLWIQEKQENGEFRFKKSGRTENPAGAMTKYLNGNKLSELVKTLSHNACDGRAQEGLPLRALGHPGACGPSSEETRPRRIAKTLPR